MSKVKKKLWQNTVLNIIHHREGKEDILWLQKFWVHANFWRGGQKVKLWSSHLALVQSRDVSYIWICYAYDVLWWQFELFFVHIEYWISYEETLGQRDPTRVSINYATVFPVVSIARSNQSSKTMHHRITSLWHRGYVFFKCIHQWLQDTKATPDLKFTRTLKMQYTEFRKAYQQKISSAGITLSAATSASAGNSAWASFAPSPKQHTNMTKLQLRTKKPPATPRILHHTLGSQQHYPTWQRRPRFGESSRPTYA